MSPLYAALMRKDTRASRLLDAHVAWMIDRLTGDEVATTVSVELDELLESGSRLATGALVGADDVKALVRRLMETVPPSTGASALVERAADVAYDGPSERFSLADVVDRENVERITDEVLGASDLVEALLDRLTESPLAATLASRFVGRVVNDVVQTNRAMAERIPGVGSLVTFGAKSAGRVIGAADRQLEQVLGDTAAKGAVFVMRRLNRIIVETLQDPTTHDAVLEIFDLYADQPVPRLDRIGRREDVHRVAALIQDIVVAGAPTEPVLALADALVDGFFSVYGDEPVTVLLEDLDLDRDLLAEHAVALVSRLLATAHESGDLELFLRHRLAPFYDSSEVAAILG